MSDPNPFVSYAQNGEDVILWRALGDRSDVFYVDVGAFDPNYDSVTRALYERGWRGINIEPQPDRLEAFERERPEDTNLSLAIGDRDGTATLTLPDNPGWASLLDPALTGSDPASARTLTVPLRRLDTLLPEIGVERVDVLKIDVEGAEPAVVRGLVDGPVRPLVCVVEGVAPGVGRTAGDEAVALLVAAGYLHCLFDGLNHYLTTDPALQLALSVPASPVDEYRTDLVDRLLRERSDLHSTIAALAAENVALRGLDGVPPASPSSPAHDVDPGLAQASLAEAGAVEANSADNTDSTDLGDDGGGRAPTPAVATAAVTLNDLNPASRLSRRRAMFVRLLRGAPKALPRQRGANLLPSVLALALVDRPASAAVSILYQAVLGRDAEPDGLATWTAHLEAGMPLFDVAIALAQSNEASRQSLDRRSRVQADLAAWSSHRAATELGLAGWRPSTTYHEGLVAHEIFVTALFEAGLAREPKPDETSFEVAKLAAGVGREWMLRAFADRPEVRLRFLGDASGGPLHRVRRWWTGRHHVDTFRALVAAAEDRQLDQILAALAVAGPRIQELTMDLADATEES